MPKRCHAGKSFSISAYAFENLEVSERMGIIFFHKSYRCSFLSRYSSQPCLRSSVRTALQLENLALRHQIGVLQRSPRKRSKLSCGSTCRTSGVTGARRWPSSIQ